MADQSGLEGLTEFTVKHLVAAGLTSRDELVAYYRLREFDVIPNIGRKSADEIVKWLGNEAEPLRAKALRLAEAWFAEQRLADPSIRPKDKRLVIRAWLAALEAAASER